MAHRVRIVVWVLLVACVVPGKAAPLAVESSLLRPYVVREPVAKGIGAWARDVRGAVFTVTFDDTVFYTDSSGDTVKLSSATPVNTTAFETDADRTYPPAIYYPTNSVRIVCDGLAYYAEEGGAVQVLRSTAINADLDAREWLENVMFPWKTDNVFTFAPADEQVLHVNFIAEERYTNLETGATVIVNSATPGSLASCRLEFPVPILFSSTGEFVVDPISPFTVVELPSCRHYEYWEQSEDALYYALSAVANANEDFAPSWATLAAYPQFHASYQSCLETLTAREALEAAFNTTSGQAKDDGPYSFDPPGCADV
eukprot:TRINITY_DN35589_c0_g1_i1.p1 TRINITY_DN35589_c0_g1~~TRINITY_DN35589_c0_g1_i1.p1  ORF type:complete len:314 (-),score=53.82 TRINITY_DN35589_c0_g1_i1:29-970(-)